MDLRIACLVKWRRVGGEEAVSTVGCGSHGLRVEEQLAKGAVLDADAGCEGKAGRGEDGKVSAFALPSMQSMGGCMLCARAHAPYRMHAVRACSPRIHNAPSSSL